MGSCFSIFLLAAGGIFVMLTTIRWFEQTAEAVHQRRWKKLSLLIAMPFAVWFSPSRVGAGRPTPVPRHEPVRGFGKVSLAEPVSSTKTDRNPPMPANTPPSAQSTEEGPPPGTPREFIGMPLIPPRKPQPRAAVDPEKLAKLKQKMREQGMLPPEDEET